MNIIPSLAMGWSNNQPDAFSNAAFSLRSAIVCRAAGIREGRKTVSPVLVGDHFMRGGHGGSKFAEQRSHP
jgi:hypothetical protein